MNRLKSTLVLILGLMVLLLVGCDDSTGTSDQKPTGKTVVITAPVANATFTVGDPITVKANVGEAGAVVYCESFPLTFDETAPYEIIVPTMTAGIDTLVMCAEWSDGTIAMDTVVVMVQEDSKVIITAPTTGTAITTGQTVTIAATVEGTPTKVDCINKGAIVSSAVTAPFEFAYTVPAIAGLDTVIIQGTWADGTLASDTVVLNIINSGKTIAITSPGVNATFTVGDPITVKANVGEAGATVYCESFPLTFDETAPYEIIVPTMTAGIDTLVMCAEWSDGTIAMDTVVVTVQEEGGNNDTTFTVAAPLTGASFGVNKEVTVSGIAKVGTTLPISVRTYINGNFANSTETIGTDGAYTTSIFTSQTAGVDTLLVQALWGPGIVSEKTILLTVTDGGDTEASLIITSPTDNQVITPGTNATFAMTLANYETYYSIYFYLNGEELPPLPLDLQDTIIVPIPTASFEEGTYTLVAKMGEFLSAIVASDTVTFTIGTEVGDPEIFFQNVGAADTIIRGQYDYELGVKIKNYDSAKHSVTSTLNGVSIVETHMQPVDDTGGTSFYGLDTLHQGTYEIVVSLLEGATLLGADTLNLTVADSILWQEITPAEGTTLSLDSAVTISASVTGEIASMVLYMDGVVLGTQSADFNSLPFWEKFTFEYIGIEKFSLGAKVLTFEATTKSGKTFTKNVNITCVVNAPKIRCYAVKKMGQDVFYYHDTISLRYLIDNVGPFPGYECEVYIHETIKVSGSKIDKGIEMPDMKNFRKPGLFYGEGVHEMVWVVTAPSGFVASRDTVTFEVVKE